MEDPRPEVAARQLPVMQEVIRWVGVFSEHKLDSPEVAQAMVELRLLVDRELRWIDRNVNLDPMIKTNDTLWSYTSCLAQIGDALDQIKAVYPRLFPGPISRMVMASVIIKDNLLERYKATAGRLPDEPIH